MLRKVIATQAQGILIAIVASTLLAAGGLLFAQGAANGLLADHRRLIDALDILAEDINQLTDQLFFLDKEQNRLHTELQGERTLAASGFMAMLRLSMSHRPSILIQPNAAVDSARARALLANIRPEQGLSEQQTVEALAQLQSMQQKREDAFDHLAKAEAQYDALQLAVTKLLANASLDAPIIGQAERTYLTEVDKILGSNSAEIQTVGEQVQPTASPADVVPVAPNPAQAAPTALFSKPNDLETWSQGQRFSWPLSQRKVISGFGGTRAGRQFSEGVLIESSNDASSVQAPFDGQVLFSDQLDGFQHTIILQHAPSVVSIISGLQDSTVRTGQWLYQGDPLGTISRVDGRPPRIFWQVRQGSRLVNPATWVN